MAGSMAARKVLSPCSKEKIVRRGELVKRINLSPYSSFAVDIAVIGVGKTAMQAIKILAVLQSINTKEPFSEPIASTASSSYPIKQPHVRDASLSRQSGTSSSSCKVWRVRMDVTL